MVRAVAVEPDDEPLHVVRDGDRREVPPVPRPACVVEDRELDAARLVPGLDPVAAPALRAGVVVEVQGEAVEAVHLEVDGQVGLHVVVVQMDVRVVLPADGLVPDLGRPGAVVPRVRPVVGDPPVVLPRQGVRVLDAPVGDDRAVLEVLEEEDRRPRGRAGRKDRQEGCGDHEGNEGGQHGTGASGVHGEPPGPRDPCARVKGLRVPYRP